MRLKLIGIGLLVLLSLSTFIYFRYFFTYEQKNVLKRRIETITGQNLMITVFSFDGKILKRWTNVKKITSGKDGRPYTFFYTRDNRYVQLPNSVQYIAEEIKE
mgnify:CR=1 FL=1